MKYLFLAGHVQYARYITQYLMEMLVHAEDNVDIDCCQQDGYGNAVSSDKFGDQTAIRICKAWHCPLIWLMNETTRTNFDGLESVCLDSEPGCSSQELHMVEMKTSYGFRRSGSHFCRGRQISSSSTDNWLHLYNPVANQIASVYVNIADSIVFWEKMERKFTAKTK